MFWGSSSRKATQMTETDRRIAPSGEQHEITHGEQHATIVEVGGGIRAYQAGDRPVLDPYPLEAMCDAAHGAPLIPWPNRLADGRYMFDGVEHQVALSEPQRHNAIHGLLRWRSWRAAETEPNRVAMAIRLDPMEGYPFALEVRIDYELSDAGLTVSTSASNIGERPCPYGAGQHPYLSAGGGLVDECALQLGAETRILIDEQRKLPMGHAMVEGTYFDFRVPRLIGEQRLDFPFADLVRDDAGIGRARLSAPDGTSVELWVDKHYPVIEIYTGDDLTPARRRRGLAVEPMTCAPNAFQSGKGLLTLDPGERFTARWGVRLL
jgi:aldose 1-epimerase